MILSKVRRILAKRNIVLSLRPPRGKRARCYLQLSKEPDLWYFAIGFWRGRNGEPIPPTPPAEETKRGGGRSV